MREDELPDAYFHADHFIAVEDGARARALFKRSVRNVVVELFSFCNRRCDYCPVSQVDRISSVSFLPSGILDTIIANLREIDYSEGVCLNLYNEPTAQRAILLDTVRRLRREVPGCSIFFASNGDYLDKDYVRELAEAGVSTIYVTLHGKIGEPYSDIYSLNRFAEFSHRLGQAPKFDSFEPNRTIRATYRHRALTIVTWTFNLHAGGTTRGDLIATVRADGFRSSPCDRVFTDFTVSYDGSLFPCCQLFTNAASHDPYRLGNLADFPSIFDAYATGRFAGWRRGLLTWGDKQAPCSTCLEREIPGTEEAVALRGALGARLMGAG